MARKVEEELELRSRRGPGLLPNSALLRGDSGFWGFLGGFGAFVGVGAFRGLGFGGIRVWGLGFRGFSGV